MLLSSLLQCTAFVKEFAPEIIQLVDQVIDPDTLCKVNMQEQSLISILCIIILLL